MGESGLGLAASMCLCLFQIIVVGVFAWMVVRLAMGSRTRAHAGWLGRFCIEYLGNVDPAGSAERRRNLRGRELIDWVKYQIEQHGLPAGQEQRLLRLARQVARDEAPLPSDDEPRSGN
jgi:hypothetical protein